MEKAWINGEKDLKVENATWLTREEGMDDQVLIQLVLILNGGRVIGFAQLLRTCVLM